MMLSHLVMSQVPFGDLFCHCLGQVGIPVAQGHQDADSLNKFGICQVSELDIVC